MALSLIAKIFYNRKTDRERTELFGFIAFASIVVVIAVLAIVLNLGYTNTLQLFLLITGGITANILWPQYGKP